MYTRQISHSKSLEACHGEITKLVDIAVPGNTKTPKKYAVNVFDLSFVFSINKLEVNYIFCESQFTKVLRYIIFVQFLSWSKKKKRGGGGVRAQ